MIAKFKIVDSKNNVMFTNLEESEAIELKNRLERLHYDEPYFEVVKYLLSEEN